VPVNLLRGSPSPLSQYFKRLVHMTDCKHNGWSMRSPSVISETICLGSRETTYSREDWCGVKSRFQRLTSSMDSQSICWSHNKVDRESLIGKVGELRCIPPAPELKEGCVT
jgi:hypothetical protein